MGVYLISFIKTQRNREPVKVTSLKVVFLGGWVAQFEKKISQNSDFENESCQVLFMQSKQVSRLITETPLRRFMTGRNWTKEMVGQCWSQKMQVLWCFDSVILIIRSLLCLPETGKCFLPCCKKGEVILNTSVFGHNNQMLTLTKADCIKVHLFLEYKSIWGVNM